MLTKFDKKVQFIDAYGKNVPEKMIDSAIHVNDTLELAWASAQSVFGKAAKPEHAIAIVKLIEVERAARRNATPEEENLDE